MPVHDHRIDTAAGELVGKHQPRRAGSHDKDICIHPEAPVNARPAAMHRSVGRVRRSDVASGRTAASVPRDAPKTS
jgi:hypothetical protein